MLFRRLVLLCLAFSLVVLSGCDREKLSSFFNFGQPPAASPKPQPPSPQEPSGTVLASIENRIITLEEFNQRIDAYNKEIEASKDIPGSVKSEYLIESLEDKKALLDRMVEKELIVIEALERGLDKDPDLQEAIKALKEQFLFAKVIEAERQKISVTSQEVENYYNLYKDVFKIPEERKISMIVLPSEQKAKELMIQLLQGADFATMARADSIDNQSATQGGDIGFVTQKTPFTPEGQKTMFDKFEQVAFALELNQVSNIFKGADGYYIIKVTEIKPAHQKLLSDVYADIEQGLLLKKQEQALETLIGNLRKSANIVIYDQLLR